MVLTIKKLKFLSFVFEQNDNLRKRESEAKLGQVHVARIFY